MRGAQQTIRQGMRPVMTILAFIKEMQQQIPKLPSALDATYLDFFNYLSEYKTIALRLPRRSGKTTAAIELHREQSSLLYHNYIPTKGFNIERELNKLRGIRLHGFKASVMIFDEYQENPPGFEALVSTLAVAGGLARDFHIVRLYT